MRGMLLLLLLSGCASVPAKVDVPVSLLVECKALNKLNGTTGKDLLENIVSNAQIYYDCADRHQKLIEAVKPKR